MRNLIFVLATLPSIARADPSAADKALAQSLFKDGRTLLNAGKTAEACAKFQESDKLDPEIGTHLNLALCHETLGKTASAWVEFGEVADQADRIHDDERSKFAHQHVQDLEKKIARVRLHVDHPAPGMSVKIDAQTIAQGGWSAAVPLDPGAHDVRAEAPGKQAFSQRIDVPQTTDVTIPELAAPSAPLAVEKKSSSSLRTVGFITAGAGIAGIAVGSIFGVLTISQNGTANDNCPMDRCTQKGVDAGNAASTFATVSTIAFIAGGALLAGGTVLILVGKPKSKSGVRVMPLFGGLGLAGSF